jgi:signal peptidase I
MISAFPNGVSSYGIPLIGSGHILTTGDVFFVSSTRGSNGYDGRSPDRPWATVDYSVERTTASRGDTVIVMPNHEETSTNTAGYWAFDVAGGTYIGIGSYKQRPRLLLDAGTAATITVSAADITLRNFEIASGTASVTRCLNVTSSGLWLDEVEINDNTTSEFFLIAVDCTSTTDGNASGLRMTNCRVVSGEATTNVIKTAGDVSLLRYMGNLVVTEGTSVPILNATGKDMKMCDFRYNWFSNKVADGTNFFASNDTASPNNSGIIAHNRFGHADVTGAHTIGAVGGCRFFDNLSVSTDALSGLLLPAADVDL